MPDTKLFQAVNKNINKYEIRLKNYVIPSLETHKLSKSHEDKNAENGIECKTSVPHSQICLKEEEHAKTQKHLKHPEEVPEVTPEEKFLKARTATVDKYAVFWEIPQPDQPKLCMWLYMPEKAVQDLLNLTRREEIRKTVDNKMELEYPKGMSRILAIELVYSVVRFCQKCKFNVAQTGTMLSIFYLTHQYFLGSFNTTVDKTYHFFKEYLLLHCFECPPDSMQLFSYKESTHVAHFFCSLYLRNLPLIRLLTLPNFAFYLNYEKQPDPFEEMGKKGKAGKGKKEGKGKKSKSKK